MSRLRVQSTLTALAIGLLIFGTAMEVEAGRGGGRGGRSFGRRSGGSSRRSGGSGRRSGGFSRRGRGISRRNNRGQRNGRSRSGGRRNRGQVSSRVNRGNRGGDGRHISHRGSNGRRAGGRGRDWGFGRRGFRRHHHHHGFGFGYYRRPVGFGFLYVSGGDDYYNPYCEAPIDEYDYTTPVATFDSATSESTAGLQAFDAAIESFLAEDYESALTSITTAARELPSNSDVHQFHGLVLFAIGNYRDSAAVIHASLTNSSGWNWDTLRSFYSAAAVYTKQLRALEEAKKANPDAAELRFLLGYHYLMLNHKEAAGKQLDRVIALQPNDELAKQLLKLAGTPTKPESETTPEESTLSGLGALAEAGNGNVAEEPEAEEPQAKQPVPETPTLVGSWTAKPVEGVVITLVLQENDVFTWKVTTDGETEEFSGKVTYNGNKVTLTRDNSEEKLEGTLTIESPQSFRFQLDDGPELTFNRS